MQRPGHPSHSLDARRGSNLPKVHRKSLIRSIDYWTLWLTQESKSHAIRIRRVVRSDDLPSSLLGHFACDCSEHALTIVHHTQEPLPNDVFDLLEAKRDWLEGNTTWEQFQTTLQAAQATLEDLGRRLPPLARQAIRSLSQSSPHASVQVFTEAFHAHLSPWWLCEHLVQCLEEYRSQYVRLLSLLVYRKNVLDPLLQQWQENLEDALFDTSS
ncbi:MAG: hypothetical protein EP343_10730 [Deltaproteobacteria bacterium]|nr:MAG: hypothetical protein EP343_10730 [Deltaproteobacteria bacterium]